MKKFMLLHGVNHNMFGKRNPGQYGTTAGLGADVYTLGLRAPADRTRE